MAHSVLPVFLTGQLYHSYSETGWAPNGEHLEIVAAGLVQAGCLPVGIATESKQ